MAVVVWVFAGEGLHTPLLLLKIVPENLQKRCPLFRELYNYLHDFCSNY